MMRFLVVAACVFGASVAAADDLTLAETDRLFAVAGAKERIETLEMLDDLIAQAVKKVAAAKADKRLDSDERAAIVEELREEIGRRETSRANIERDTYVYPVLPIEKLAVGQVGIAVMDEEEQTYPYGRVLKIIDNKNIVLRIEGTETAVWLQSEFRQPPRISGRHQLECIAVVGTRQIGADKYLVCRPYTPPDKRTKPKR